MLLLSQPARLRSPVCVLKRVEDKMAITGYRGPRLPSQPQGHEDAFPRPRLSARCRFSQGTFAETLGNGRDAPTADIQAAANKPPGSTQN